MKSVLKPEGAGLKRFALIACLSFMVGSPYSASAGSPEIKSKTCRVGDFVLGVGEVAFSVPAIATGAGFGICLGLITLPVSGFFPMLDGGIYLGKKVLKDGVDRIERSFLGDEKNLVSVVNFSDAHGSSQAPAK